MTRDTDPAPAISDTPEGRNFIQQIVEDDLKNDRTGGRVLTRFPPEPNGYLHIGHAKALAISFGIAAEFGGLCNLRFDDTNPETEDMAYVRAIKEDIRWLGFDWDDREYFASDYFDQLYGFALQLIDDGRAYVDSLNEEEIREFRGTVTEPGTDSPYRSRTITENRDLFQRMRAGEFPNGAHVLRAKIDMASNNMLLRDPVIYRIKHASHYRRGNDFPIYPMYDFAHPLSDAIEGITHSLCSLEFEVHRPLYDWLVDAIFSPPRPHQYEFARLNLDYTVMSKRKLLQLVADGFVSGWDDPRMPTLAGFRRRGVTPEAIRNFAEMIGVAKADNRVDIAMLEYAIRDDLNTRAPRVMCVIRPLRVVITNFPEDRIDWSEAPYWPHDIPKSGSRRIPFSREIFIDRDDFQEHPESGFFRLSPGGEVRLRYGYVIRCDEVIKGPDGEITTLHCSYDPDTRSGTTTGGRRVKGTIHWVSAAEGVRVQVRLYDRLFGVPDPDDIPEGKTFLDHLNRNSLEILSDCVIEPSVVSTEPGKRFQFERAGYFVVDQDSTENELIFNRTITLRDTWAKANEPISKSGDASDQSKPATSKKTVAPELNSWGLEPIAYDPLASLTETAAAEAKRLASAYNLPLDDVALFAGEADWISFFEASASAAEAPEQTTGIMNWIVQVMRPAMTGRNPATSGLKPASLARLVALQADGTISSRIASDLFSEMMESGKSPDILIEEQGLQQISDPDTIVAFVEEILVRFPDRVEAYRSGKTGLMGFFVGQVMQKSGGKANPQLTKKILTERLA